MIKNTPSRSSLKQMGEESRMRSRAERTVCFDSISIREYGCTLGRGNVCTTGCPISLDWNIQNCFYYTVDRYEQEKTESKRRVRGELFIAPSIRSHRLLAHGFSIDQIVDGVFEAEVIRKQRAKSYQKKPRDGFICVLEATGRRLKKVVGPLRKNTESATAA
jgi:hypothetical protein